MIIIITSCITIIITTICITIIITIIITIVITIIIIIIITNNMIVISIPLLGIVQCRCRTTPNLPTILAGFRELDSSTILI